MEEHVRLPCRSGSITDEAGVFDDSGFIVCALWRSKNISPLERDYPKVHLHLNLHLQARSGLSSKP